MIASLPMYDRAETAGANDRLWQHIRTALRNQGISAPEILDRSGQPMAIWTAPDLALSQSCGLPYRMRLHQKVNLIAAPVHTLDLAGGHYRSVVVARQKGDLAGLDGARFAYNDETSQSGWAAFWLHAPDFRPRGLVRTGAHRASAKAVAMGRADIASIDAVSWDMIRDWDTFAADLVVIAETERTPALPYICARAVDPILVGAALEAAFDRISKQDKAILRTTGVVAVQPGTYLAQPLPPRASEITLAS